jgi:hypothetical protein
MARKPRAKTASLFSTVRMLLLGCNPTIGPVGYHSNPKNPRAFSYDLDEGFCVSFEGESYFVKLNYRTNKQYFEVLIGHKRDHNLSGNNPDISFTESHFNQRLLIISPSLKRCNGILLVEPKALGDFPARVIGKKSRFVIGFPDSELFPRLFRLCLAKKNSIDLSKTKVPNSAILVKRARVV